MDKGGHFLPSREASGYHLEREHGAARGGFKQLLECAALHVHRVGAEDDGDRGSTEVGFLVLHVVGPCV